MHLPSIHDAVWNLLVFLPALTFHEFSHAFVANRMGDPTARMMGRMTLNPIPHIDPIGTLILPILVGFGWAKPVPINPRNFRDPARGSLLCSAAGPGSNLLMAVVLGLLVRLIVGVVPDATVGQGGLFIEYMVHLTMISVLLALFNLIPLGPLDGHHIVEALLPYRQLVAYRQFNRYGFIIVLAVIFLAPGVFDMIIVVPAVQVARLLTGL